MQQIDLALTAIGALVLVLGLFSTLIRSRTVVSEPLVALLTGAVLGPVWLGWLNPQDWGDVTLLVEEAARVTLAIGLMAVALRLPRRFALHQWRPVATLLGLVMPLMWLTSALLIYLLLDVPLWVALLIGAIVTPTDPIVATSIVTGALAERELPDRIRHLISTESGLNDGLASPLVLLPIAFALAPVGEAARFWVGEVLLWQLGGGVIIGVMLGHAAGRLLVWAERHHSIERTSFLAYTVALSLLVLGTARVVGTAGILAVFVAGLAFDSVVGLKDRMQEEGVQEAVSQFFTLPIFILLGLVLPWEQWLALGWQGLAAAVLVVLLRRLPAVLLLGRLLRPLRGRPDLLFVGWFGPIGIAAVLYAMLSLRHTADERVWALASLVICVSIVVHGMTATPLTHLYARHTKRQR